MSTVSISVTPVKHARSYTHSSSHGQVLSPSAQHKLYWAPACPRRRQRPSALTVRALEVDAAAVSTAVDYILLNFRILKVSVL